MTQKTTAALITQLDDVYRENQPPSTGAGAGDRFEGPRGYYSATRLTTLLTDILDSVFSKSTITSSAAEITRATDVSLRLVAAGASLTLTQASHEGKTIAWDQATGSALTLPAASGSGGRYRCIVSVAVTSNDHTLACVGTDEFAGVIYQVDTDTADAVAAYPAVAADDFDTITMNGTTTGGLVGDWIEVEDVASGVWALRGWSNANGTVATPLSSAV